MSRIFSGAEKGLKISIFLRTFVHVPLSRRRRILDLLDLRDDRSVRSALFLMKKCVTTQKYTEQSVIYETDFSKIQLCFFQISLCFQKKSMCRELLHSTGESLKSNFVSSKFLHFSFKKSMCSQILQCLNGEF